MKKIILLVLTTLMIVGCEHRTTTEIEEAKHLNGFNIIIVDSCEYISRGYWLAHKGNCKFCKERKQKELKELVEQLKDR